MTDKPLLQLIRRARDEAKTILSTLEQAGHPQTNESSGLYLGLVSLQKRLAAPGADVAAELEQLVGLCKGRLESLKPLLEEALRVARSSQGSA